ncbi:MAG TPA: polysaccharide deacetylase family protein [Candidatus Methylomirabilis sp.]|nr:polysaccharide deacetylase family protein [Candidatus Methylomirabilis sp.]
MINGLKSDTRRFAARFLYLSGAIGAYRRVALRNRAVILMYHRIMPWNEGNPGEFEGMRVDPANLERQMACLRKQFHILCLNDLLQHLRDRIPFPPNSCMVTFDDGWKDNYSHAYPVLNRYEVPAVIFLSVGHIGTRKKFWQERIFNALCGIREAARRNPDGPARNRHIPGGINVGELAAWPEGKFREEVREQIRSLKKLSLSRIEPIVEELADCAGTPSHDDGESFLSWEDILAMSRGGIDFGSHGMGHEILTNISPEAVLEEARTSKSIIEERIQKSVQAFSYPNGDHDPVVRHCVRECGYQIAFGTSRGFTRHEDDPYSLKRVNVHDDVTPEVPMFLSSILGML